MNTLQRVPVLLHDRVSEFVTLISSAAPGALCSVIVIGSAISGDWWPGTSDIDVVFVVMRAFTADEARAVANLHAETVAGGPVDGVYLTDDQIAAGPTATRSAPQVVGGAFTPDQKGAQLTWITWREIEAGFEAKVTATGCLTKWRASERRFESSDCGVRVFSRQNLHEYWAPFIADATAQLVGRADDSEVSAKMLQWIALGPARVAATIDTGRVLSKSAAGRYAAERWPRYAALLSRAIASRAGASEPFTALDARQALTLARECVGTYPATL